MLQSVLRDSCDPASFVITGPVAHTPKAGGRQPKSGNRLTPNPTAGSNQLWSRPKDCRPQNPWIHSNDLCDENGRLKGGLSAPSPPFPLSRAGRGARGEGKGGDI